MDYTKCCVCESIEVTPPDEARYTNIKSLCDMCGMVYCDNCGIKCECSNRTCIKDSVVCSKCLRRYCNRCIALCDGCGYVCIECSSDIICLDCKKYKCQCGRWLKPKLLLFRMKSVKTDVHVRRCTLCKYSNLCDECGQHCRTCNNLLCYKDNIICIMCKYTVGLCCWKNHKCAMTILKDYYNRSNVFVYFLNPRMLELILKYE